MLLSRVPIHPPSQHKHHLAAVDARDQLDQGVVRSRVYICGIVDTDFLDDCPSPSGVEGETSPPIFLLVPYLIYLSNALNLWIYGVMCPAVRNKMKKTFFAWRVRGSTVSAGPEVMVVSTLPTPQRKSAINNITHVSDFTNVSS